MDAGRLVDALADAGWTEFSGVPCSILEPVRAAAGARPGTRYLPATVEGEALAIAAGHWLGGGTGAVVLLQNSGLGNVVNPLSSLLIPYRIPALLVVSWRGQPDVADAVHHHPMGAATLPLLELFSIPFQVLDGQAAPDTAVSAALDAAESRCAPAALVVPRGALKGARAADVATVPVPAPAGDAAAGEVPVFGAGAPADRAALVAAVAERFRGDAMVSTTGYMSRALAAHGPRGEHFYMQGSMGFAPAIALGVARARPGRVVVLDGDGALLMRLGTLATIGHAAPGGLVHVVGDNGSYASTGGQPSAAANTSFPRVALACGYRRAASCVGADGMDEALAWAAAGEGPTLLHVRISPTEPGGADRPEAAPDEIAAAFRARVGGGRA
jgi:phosphonopyruvate decarboxylase